MEETKEDMTNQKSGRQMTTYSAEMKLSLLAEYREVADTISFARFAREHDLSLGTFYGWMKKAGIKAPQPTRKFYHLTDETVFLIRSANNRHLRKSTLLLE